MKKLYFFIIFLISWIGVNSESYDLTSVDENGVVVNGAGNMLDGSGQSVELTTTTISANPNNNNNNITIIEGDSLVNATRGKVAVLTCIVNNLKNYKITWYFQNILLTYNLVRIKDDKRYSVDNVHPNEWRLLIDPVDSANEGQYSCHLNNGMKKMIYLKVGVSPTFVENNGSHQILINTIEKQNVTLSCEADGNPTPTIYWYRDYTLISTGPHLVLKDINRHSHTEYECVARNNIEPDPSRHFKINVNFKPTLNLMYYLKEANKKLSTGNSVVAKSEESLAHHQSIGDGDLQLVCEITGNPINSITWLKDGQKVRDESSSQVLNDRFLAYRSGGNVNHEASSNEIMSSKKRRKHISIHTSQLNSHRFISKLKIKNFDKSDNGLYKCSVNGFEGDYFKSIVIDEIKSQLSSEVEYTFSLQEKAVPKSGKDKIFKLSTSKSKSVDMNNHQIESSYLVNERARGARSNITKSETATYELDSENSAVSIQYSIVTALSIIISLFALKGA